MRHRQPGQQSLLFVIGTQRPRGHVAAQRYFAVNTRKACRRSPGPSRPRSPKTTKKRNSPVTIRSLIRYWGASADQAALPGIRHLGQRRPAAPTRQPDRCHLPSGDQPRLQAVPRASRAIRVGPSGSAVRANRIQHVTRHRPREPREPGFCHRLIVIDDRARGTSLASVAFCTSLSSTLNVSSCSSLVSSSKGTLMLWMVSPGGKVRTSCPPT